jgi:hypothetical protein
MDIVDRYFDDAARIYAICGDENLSDDEARLLTYIHVKAQENPNGLDFLDDPDGIDRDALRAMLGDCTIAETMVAKDGTVVYVGGDLFPEIGRSIASIDAAYHLELGMENRISGELRNRLRLYTDDAFREKMVSLYRKKIAPRIFSTGKEAVIRSFRSYREKNARQEQELRDMLDN